jgi:hypothetical protein
MQTDFRPFSAAVSNRLKWLSENFTEFYKVDCPNIFDAYLSFFPDGTNPIFRERTEHDCQCCKSFIRNLGRIVAIKDQKIYTVWGEIGDLCPTYSVVAAAMDELVSNSPIQSVFRTQERSFSVEKNLDANSDIVWHHFHGNTPRPCVHSSPGEEIGRINGAYSVFKRGLDELRVADLDEIVSLIDDGAIYRGEEHRKSVVEFRSLLRKYAQATEIELFAWEHIHSPSARFKNTVIGTLAVDLANSVDIERAVKSFEAKVAPGNYKRPKALITPGMINSAVDTLKRLDLEDSINRRFASVEDISVNDIIFVDNSVIAKTKDGIADLLMQEVRPSSPKAAGVEIGIEDFIAMRSKAIDLVIEPSHLGNFVSITAPAVSSSPSLFKWDNAFGWAYDGDVADSVKERVKKAGGNVDAKMRCSLAWSNYDDLDIHCVDPSGQHISYRNKLGILDVDMNAGGASSREPVENLSWQSIADGEYSITVNSYRQRERKDTGFQLQVEFEKQVYNFAYDRPILFGQNVHCLTLVVKDGALVDVKTFNGVSGESSISVDKWGIRTGRPARVNMMMLSPNHWDNSSKTGNKHYFFILDGCLNPEPARGIFNEFLISSLEPHRKVFEILASKTKCQPTNNQLSGVGFSSTKSDSVKVIADGRPFTIKF